MPISSSWLVCNVDSISASSWDERCPCSSLKDIDDMSLKDEVSKSVVMLTGRPVSSSSTSLITLSLIFVEKSLSAFWRSATIPFCKVMRIYPSQKQPCPRTLADDRVVSDPGFDEC